MPYNCPIRQLYFHILYTFPTVSAITIHQLCESCNTTTPIQLIRTYDRPPNLRTPPTLVFSKQCSGDDLAQSGDFHLFHGPPRKHTPFFQQLYLLPTETRMRMRIVWGVRNLHEMHLLERQILEKTKDVTFVLCAMSIVYHHDTARWQYECIMKKWQLGWLRV